MKACRTRAGVTKGRGQKREERVARRANVETKEKKNRSIGLQYETISHKTSSFNSIDINGLKNV